MLSSLDTILVLVLGVQTCELENEIFKQVDTVFLIPYSIILTKTNPNLTKILKQI